MKYLLDTNVCVDYLNARFPKVIHRIQSCSPKNLAVSAVAVAELRFGAEKSAHKGRNHERLDVFLADVQCVDFGADAALVYGQIRTALERRGAIIGPYDMQIAAHALSLGVVLVSDNVREFRRVRGLRVENWRR